MNANTDKNGDTPPADKGNEYEFADVVDALCSTDGKPIIRRNRQGQPLPSRDAIIRTVEELRSVLFPGYFGVSNVRADNIRFHVGSTLDRVKRTLEDQVKWGLCFVCEEKRDCTLECDERARGIVASFIGRLPEVRRMLATDVQAAFEGDPAATSPDETIFCYPGISAITSYRLAHELYLLRVPLIPRIITEHAHSITGIDIHPGTRIGERFFIDHGTGVVIGETSVIGKGVRIYQGVTLGAKSFPLDEQGNPIKGIDRHPVVEDDVIIYSGATILGRVVIGEGSVIGGNVWLIHSVPPQSHITQVEASSEEFENGTGI